MATNEQLEQLREEFKQCEENYGKRILALEISGAARLTKVETQLTQILTSLTTFVSHHQFRPVELLAYGMAAGVLMTVLGAILAKIVGI